MIRASRYVRLLTTLMLLQGAPAALAASSSVAASPIHSDGPNAVYPRLTAFPDAAIMKRVNEALSAQEMAENDNKKQCFQQLQNEHEQPDADSYGADITVTALSKHFMSIDVRVSRDCGGAYPVTGEETPMTFDLTTGAPVDWNAMFMPGFLPSGDDSDPASISLLTTLYRARYRPGMEKDNDCQQVVKQDDPFAEGAILWLDDKRGLVVQPDLPHATAACADVMVFSAADLKQYIADKSLLLELAHADAAAH